MFKNYYEILGLTEFATETEIKIAFKKQAILWHPDRNPGIDTTAKMQEINEAKLILLDSEARRKYDIEYARYKEFRKQATPHSQQPTENEIKFQVRDDVLYKWMKNARKQSIELAKETIREFKEMAKVGAKAGLKAAGNAIVGQFILGIVILTIILLFKTIK